MKLLSEALSIIFLWRRWRDPTPYPYPCTFSVDCSRYYGKKFHYLSWSSFLFDRSHSPVTFFFSQNAKSWWRYIAEKIWKQLYKHDEKTRKPNYNNKEVRTGEYVEGDKMYVVVKLQNNVFWPRFTFLTEAYIYT